MDESLEHQPEYSECKVPNLASELVAFTFSLDGVGEEVRKAPMAYIPDLKAKVKQLLGQQNHTSATP